MVVINLKVLFFHISFHPAHKPTDVTASSDQVHLVSLLANITSGMEDMVMEEEDDCPELVPIDTPPAAAAEQIPVTIITGYLGERLTVLPAALMSLWRRLQSGICQSVLSQGVVRCDYRLFYIMRIRKMAIIDAAPYDRFAY